MSRTNVKVEKETWQDLNALKEPGDTFDDVIRDLLEESEDDEPEPATADS